MLRRSVPHLRQILEILRVDGTQRHAMPRHQSEEIKILNILFPQVVIEATTCRVYSCTLYIDINIT